MARSPFDLKQQDKHIDSKIVVALERISEAFRVLLWKEGKEHGLSPIQIQILIFLLFHSKEKCKVSYLADEFNLTKATISDSVKMLLQKKMVHKEDDAADTRSYTISLTAEGKKLAQQSAPFAGAIEKPLQEFSPQQKEMLLLSLLSMIEKLNQDGIITLQRMCYTCSYYNKNGNKHYCQLLQKPLLNSELRVDCPEHESISA